MKTATPQHRNVACCGIKNALRVTVPQAVAVACCVVACCADPSTTTILVSVNTVKTVNNLNTVNLTYIYYILL